MDKVILANEDRPTKQLPDTIFWGPEMVARECCCIYRVPKIIRKENEEAYTPQLVSIGPFHHGRESLRSMEQYKLRCMRKFLGRSSVSLESYVESIMNCEERVRSCYEGGRIEMCSRVFSRMMLVDGCFIIELLMSSYFSDLRGDRDGDGDDDDDFIFSEQPRVLSGIYRDLILLENQIPFFLLERLFFLAFSGIPRRLPSLLDLSLKFFGSQNPQNKLQPSLRSSSSLVNHFTDLIRILYLPTARGGRGPPPPRDDDDVKRGGRVVKIGKGYTATQLHEAGVRFNVGLSKCLLDIQFSDGVLEIPCLNLYDKTECIIRNLMALEICHYPDDSYIKDYAAFMDILIDSPRDVELLVGSGILANWCDNKQGGSSTDHVIEMFAAGTAAATLFSAAGDNGRSFYFSDLYGRLEAYCDKNHLPMRRWEKWASALRHDILGSPWRLLITAILLFTLVLVQTLCAIINLTHTTGRRLL